VAEILEFKSGSGSWKMVTEIFSKQLNQSNIERSFYENKRQ